MKYTLLLIFLVLLSNCSSTSGKIHNQTDMFVDIETSKNNVFIECPLPIADAAPPIALLTFYLLHGDTTYEFLYRRFEPYDFCLKVQASYEKMLKNASKVRIVGVQPFQNKTSPIDEAPSKFKNSKNFQTWYFSRLHTETECKSHFTDDCKTENYWAGMAPKKE